jgi:hypothetical protein
LEGRDSPAPSTIGASAVKLSNPSPSSSTFFIIFLASSSFILRLLIFKTIMNRMIAKKAIPPSTLPIIVAVRDIRPSFTLSKAVDWFPVLGDKAEDSACDTSLVVKKSGTMVVPPFGSVIVDEPSTDWVPFTIPLVDDTVDVVAELD